MELIMAITITRDKGRYTNEAEEFLNQYADAFGEVVRATMEKRLGKVEYKLTLYNKDGDTLIFENSLTAGYVGGGSNGTYRVLQKCGFNITEEYIHTTEKFDLVK
jgi:hypothetical protein